MHSINSGFLGSKVPLKDKTKFKIPNERRYHDKSHGKWTNFPMTVEIQRYAKGAETPTKTLSSASMMMSSLSSVCFYYSVF